MTLGSLFTCSIDPSDKHLALVKNGDAMGDVLDEFHVVLDHEDRSVLE